MTTKIIAKEEIRAQLLKVLSGYCFRERRSSYPELIILSPWISDVELQLNKQVFDLDDVWFGLDYGIESINLAYALLLLRLDFGAKVQIVTLPPNHDNYGDGAYYHQRLLEFLDEIGCSVYLNTSLHSKLILSNDSALLGSFNLSKNALYNREEVGVSIDDIDNLKILESYAHSIISSSAPYGYTAKSCKMPLRRVYAKHLPDKITRGMLYERIVQVESGTTYPNSLDYGSFLKDKMGLESYYSKYVISEITTDLEEFYFKALFAYLEPSKIFNTQPETEVERLSSLKSLFDYKGKLDSEEITKFVRERFVRRHLPRIKLKLVRMPKVEGEVTPKWVSDLE